MLDLFNCRRIAVVGGGSAGWFSALELRQLFPERVEIVLIESEALGIIGAGEGSLPNFNRALARYKIDKSEFMRETRSTYKLGVALEGWRTGAADDVFYHQFLYSADNTDLLSWTEPNGSLPLASALINQGFQLDHYSNLWQMCRKPTSQAEVEHYLAGLSNDSHLAYHFDARKLASYLKEVAVKRGVKHINATVENVRLDSQRNVSALVMQNGELEVDFVIDASGLRRVIIEKALKTPWQSFSDCLLLDSALPFFIPARSKHPPLITRAIAMKNGWMWSIPTLERLGIGYAYSSKHTDKDSAILEVQNYWGMEIDPANHFHFSPGHFEQVWIGNVMAVGLSSGFVEPLEATSIAQTLDQLARFSHITASSNGFIPQQLVDQFNREVRGYWDGIRDFLFLHYNTSRADTQFWRDASQAPAPASFAELKKVLAIRPPRLMDMEPYSSGPYNAFGPLSWMLIASPLGLLPREATAMDLVPLSAEKRKRLAVFLDKTVPRLRAQQTPTALQQGYVTADWS